MKKLFRNTFPFILVFTLFSSCKETTMSTQTFETSAAGNKLTEVNCTTKENPSVTIKVNADQPKQTITGFGGSFTQASAYLVNGLGEENRNKVMVAYFGEKGANYSLTRTHINSCDFSLENYAYANTPGDTLLKDFSIEKDKEFLIPMIKQAQALSKDGFKIISSPWTAPPWMKDNNDWRGGKLLPEYNKTWALYFSKYIEEYAKEKINIWGITVENEPLGNNSNWESMHFSAQEMTNFVSKHLGPKLEEDKHNVVLLGYDQNRDKELKEWADVMFKDKESSKYFDGTAVHWYASTYDYFGESLEYTHNKAPNKYIIQTEACADSEVPKWRDDAWYWSKEATDWGWDWASDEDKYLHPKYAPVNRYARDIIGCLNNWVDGWVDWNMVLDKQGGPNWFKNWCVAPVIADIKTDEVYFTPIYFIMSHFSKYIRPGAVILHSEMNNDKLQSVAAQNPDGSIIIVAFNEGVDQINYTVELDKEEIKLAIGPQAIQTTIINN